MLQVIKYRAGYRARHGLIAVQDFFGHKRQGRWSTVAYLVADQQEGFLMSFQRCGCCGLLPLFLEIWFPWTVAYKILKHGRRKRVRNLHDI